MKDKINEVVKILEKEYEIYKKIRKLATNKQEAVIGGDLEDLETIIRQEVEQIEILEELEEKRIELVGDVKISKLKGKISDSIKKKELTSLHNKLIKIIEEVQELNTTNNKLVKDTLQLVNLEINMLTGDEKQGTYGKSGQAGNKQQEKNASVINHKA